MPGVPSPDQPTPQTPDRFHVVRKPIEEIGHPLGKKEGEMQKTAQAAIVREEPEEALQKIAGGQPVTVVSAEVPAAVTILGSSDFGIVSVERLQDVVEISREVALFPNDKQMSLLAKMSTIIENRIIPTSNDRLIIQPWVDGTVNIRYGSWGNVPSQQEWEQILLSEPNLFTGEPGSITNSRPEVRVVQGELQYKSNRLDVDTLREFFSLIDRLAHRAREGFSAPDKQFFAIEDALQRSVVEAHKTISRERKKPEAIKQLVDALSDDQALLQSLNSEFLTEIPPEYRIAIERAHANGASHFTELLTSEVKVLLDSAPELVEDEKLLERIRTSVTHSIDTSVLRHGFSNEYSLENNIQNGIGRQFGEQEEDTIQVYENVVNSYLGGLEMPVTFSILTPGDIRLLGQAYAGSRDIMVVLGRQATLRTLFHPGDTGDPDYSNKYEPVSLPYARLLNGIRAVRHESSIQNGKLPMLRFGYWEGITAGKIMPSEIGLTIINSEVFDNDQNVVKRLRQWGIKNVCVYDDSNNTLWGVEELPDGKLEKKEKSIEEALAVAA